MASSHQQALAVMEQKSNEGLKVIVAALAVTAASSASLETQMEKSRLHAIEIVQRQQLLENVSRELPILIQVLRRP